MKVQIQESELENYLSPAGMAKHKQYQREKARKAKSYRKLEPRLGVMGVIWRK